MPSPERAGAEPPLGRADRVALRRRELGRLATQLIQERGFASLSVSEVAERASLSIGGLYRYIKTKTDLLEMACDELNASNYERMAAAAAEESGIEAKLSAAIRSYWELCWDTSSAILVSYQEWGALPEEARRRFMKEQDRSADFLADLVRAGIASGEFRQADDRLLAHEIIFLAHMRALKGWVLRDRDRADVLAEHLELVFSRLRPPG